MKRRSNGAGSLRWVDARDGEPAHWAVRVSWPDGSGRPWLHAEPGLTPAQASKWAHDLAAKGGTFVPRRGPRAAEPTTGATLSELAESWKKLLKNDKSLAPSTVSNHESNLRRVLKDFGNRKPEELSSGVLRRWLRSLAAEGLSASRIRNVHVTLARLIDVSLAEEWVELPANPAKHPAVREALPSVEAPDDIAVLSGEQIARLLKSPRHLRYSAALTSGLRAGELFGLRWADVRQEQGVWVLDVRRALQLRGPDGHASIGGLKTKSSRRLVPIHSSVLPELDAVRGKPDQPVFASATGRAYRPHAALELREDLGIEDGDLSFHATRRTFATLLATAGVPEDLRDRLLGHSPRSVAERHYVRADLERLRAAVETIRLDQHVAPGQGSAASGGPKLSQELSQPVEKKMPEQPKQEQSQQLAPVAQWIEQRFPNSNSRSAIGNASAAIDHVNAEQTSATLVDKCAIPGASDSSGQLPSDPVELALARAVELAAAAGQWDTVATLSRELGERRRAREAPSVPSLDSKRSRGRQ